MVCVDTCGMWTRLDWDRWSFGAVLHLSEERHYYHGGFVVMAALPLTVSYLLLLLIITIIVIKRNYTHAFACAHVIHRILCKQIGAHTCTYYE